MNPADTFYFEDNGKPAINIAVSGSPFGEGKLWVVDHPNGGQLGIFMGPGHEHPVVLPDRSLQKAPVEKVGVIHDSFAGATRVTGEAPKRQGGLGRRLMSWIPFVGR